MNYKARKKLMLLRLGIQFTIALVLSLAMTVFNYGLQDGFVQNWAKGFVVAFIIIPFALQLIPFVSRGICVLAGKRSPFFIRCTVAVCVATVMESIIALAVTLAQQGFVSTWLATWAMTFVKAYPMGLLIGFSMTLLVQPRMQKLAIAH